MGHKIPQNASSFQWIIDTISIVGKCFQSKSSKLYMTFADMIFFPGLFVGLRRVPVWLQDLLHTRCWKAQILHQKETVWRQGAVKVVKLTMVGAIVAKVEEQAWPSACTAAPGHNDSLDPTVGWFSNQNKRIYSNSMDLKGKFIIRPTFETSIKLFVCIYSRVKVNARLAKDWLKQMVKGKFLQRWNHRLIHRKTKQVQGSV